MNRTRKRLLGYLGATLAIVVLSAGCPRGEIVIIADDNLDAAIRAELGLPFGFLTVADLLRLTQLDARALGIVDLSGMEFCTNLEILDLSTNDISDISSLAGLINLMSLDLESNDVSDLTPLAGLVNLDSLFLFDNQIGDIQALVTNAVNGGLGPGDQVVLDIAQLSDRALTIDIPQLQALGVNVILATEESEA